MATIKDPNDDQQDSGQLGSQASSTVGTGGVTGPGPAPVAKQAPGSGMFTNLGRYMTANEGNEAVGNSVNDINQKGNQAQQAFAGAKNNFDNQKVNAPQDLSQADQSYLNNFNPKSFSYSLDNKGNIASPQNDRIAQGLAGMQYNGPSTGDIDNSYQNYAAAKSGVDDAGKLFEASPNGVANRQQQLTQTNTQRANGNYGGGMARLDSALVEHQGAGVFDPQRQALSNMAGGYGDGVAVGNQAKNLSQQSANAQSLADKAQNIYQPQFQNVQNVMNNAANANRHGAFGGGNASQNGATFPQPQFGQATAAQQASVAKRLAPPTAPVAAKPTPQPSQSSNSNKTDRVK